MRENVTSTLIRAIVALIFLLASACGNDAPIKDRPCAATSYENDVLSYTATYTWDGNNLTSAVYTAVGGEVSTEQFDYAAGRLSSYIYTAGASVTTSLRTYDLSGRLMRLVETTSEDPADVTTFSFTYDGQPIPTVEIAERGDGESRAYTRTCAPSNGGLACTVQRCISRPGSSEACDEYQETWGLGLAEHFQPSLESDLPSLFGVQRISITSATFQTVYAWRDSLLVSRTSTSYPPGEASEVTYVHTKTMDGARVVSEEVAWGGTSYKMDYSYECP